MGRNNTTSSIIDSLLRYLAIGGVLSTTVLAPNAFELIDKRLQQYMNTLEPKGQQREYQRLLTNMKKQGLISYDTEGISRGIQLTEKGRERAEKANLDYLIIPVPDEWDKHWRLVMFNVPERFKTKRDAFTRKLKELGLLQLQRGVWIHPYPCQAEVESLAVVNGIQEYITYVETSFIAHHRNLRGRFQRTLKN
jgi:hypothetical protein